MLLLATAYERSGSMELAEKQFADAMRAANFAPNVSLNYVAFLQRRGSFARAEDVLTDLAGRFPQNLQILASLGQVKLQRQDRVGAQGIADSIRRLGNDSGVADQIRGAALVGQNKIDENIPFCKVPMRLRRRRHNRWLLWSTHMFGQSKRIKQLPSWKRC